MKGAARKQAGKGRNTKSGNFPAIDKLMRSLKEKIPAASKKRLLMMNIPYLIVFYLMDKLAWLYRRCAGNSFAEKAGGLFLNFQMAFNNPIPSVYLYDLVVGITGAVIVRLAVYLKGKNAKKYRHGVEYGSARWGA